MRCLEAWALQASPCAISKRAQARHGSWLHVVFALLLVELSLLLGCGVLVLLVLRDQIVHVTLGLCELHLVHAFSCVPMKEGLAAEHGGEVLCNTLEHLLDCCRVSGKSHSHLQTFGW